MADHIIQSSFDFQKQYDLLRLQQRIDVISSLIIATSKRILILSNIEGSVPEGVFELSKINGYGYYVSSNICISNPTI